MDNQAICDLVNSKDVRKYLTDIKYLFSPAEAAWLAARCERLTLEERHAVWREIMDTMPDCRLESVHFYSQGGAYDSMHDVLRKIMTIDRRSLAEFYRKNDKAVYQHAIIWRDYANYDRYDDSPLFSEFEPCQADLKKEFTESDSDAIFRITIRKNYLDHPEKNIEIDLNAAGDVTAVNRQVSLDEEEAYMTNVFDMLWFCIPAPFKKGDIVWHRRRLVEAGPLVVDGITPERYAECGHRGADSSDMNVWGYFQNDAGELFHEVTHNYTDFEYYPEEMLVGKRRILKALSNYLKGEIVIELFALAYRRILLEEELKDSMPKWFLKEGLRLAGLVE